MLSRTLIFLALVAAAQPAPDNRQEKGLDLFPSLISIVTFNNDPCDTESGVPLQGTCYSAKECTVLKGTADGSCANNYGVCCVISGNVTISTSGSYFKGNLTGNVNARTFFPFVPPTPPVVLAYQPATALTLLPPAGTLQIRFDFEDLTVLGPIEGDCTNDTVTVVGANPGADIPVICGENAGQHLYMDIDNSDGPYNLIISTSEVAFTRSWNIKVTFLSEGDALKAPPRCLQYFTEPTGSFSMFNYAEENPIALNNQQYSVCFGYVKGYCDVGITFSRFDLGDLDGNCGDDVVAVQGQQICGDVIDFTAQANATGPIIFTVHTDDLNELNEEGFTGSYMMMEC